MAPPKTTQARDACVVDTPPLSAMLQAFVSTWNTTRRATGGRFTRPTTSIGMRAARTHAAAPAAPAPAPASLNGSGAPVPARDDDSPIGAIAWLAERTGVPEKTIDNLVHGRFESTELRIADSIVTALGRTETLHDGTLNVRPRWKNSVKARAACCGGSELRGYAQEAVRTDCDISTLTGVLT